jgi:hypothetical protein
MSQSLTQWENEQLDRYLDGTEDDRTPEEIAEENALRESEDYQDYLDRKEGE